MLKRACFATSCLCVCASFLSVLLPATAQADPLPLKVMPLGDSITVGSGGTTNLGGYRNKLFTLLTDAGYAPDFVGTQTNNSSLLTDQNHQGQGGWRIDQIDSNIEAWLNAVASPDFILLHIGTNDFGQGYNTSTAINRLDALILKMTTLRPDANIIVTNLMERGEPHNTNIQSLFNPQVPGIVNAHAAAGRKVTFLDMRAAVPLADMPDNLHPNDIGYDKMAEAWLTGIQAVMTPPEDTSPPTVASARHVAGLAGAVVRFSKPVADTAADVANYSIPGLSVTAATLSVDKREVMLTTSTQTPGTTYTITINNIADRQAVPVAMAPNSTITFTPPPPRGYAANVPDSTGYTLLQSVDLPLQASYGNAQVPYAVDNRAHIAGFDRVAYYLELEMPDGSFQFAWVSMDAFTSNVNHLGIPTYGSGAIWERGVTNVNVVSNVAGVTNGTGLVGNLEFWPTDYTGAANSGIGATGTNFDFDDTRNLTGTFGSMQIHNTTDKKTILAINDWGQTSASATIEIGIGNQPTGHPDWTHSGSGSQYLSRKLYVLVRASSDAVAPTVVSAKASDGLARVYVEFSEPVQPQTVVPENFTLSHGATVLGVEVAPNGRRATLLTTLMPVGQAVTLTVNGVRDTSPVANAIASNTQVPVTQQALPAEVGTAVGAAAANYQLVYSIDLPQTGNLNALGNWAYTWDDSAAVRPFSRVAYYLETQKAGAAAQYVWVSMNAFTQERKKLGIPTTASKAIHQMIVNDMEVLSNVAAVTPGTGIATGNIEFWPTDYSVANGLPVPGADATKYDFGDTRSSSGSFGTMQVHNHGAAQTLFAINRWGADGNPLDIGIGNSTGSAPDWTNAANAGTYYKRRLHVMVLPSLPALPTEVATNVPEAQELGYQHIYALNIPAEGNLNPPTYAVNNTALAVPFRRIAYYMELKKGATTEWVWVSADAFTTDVLKIGVPTLASGAIHQRVLNNMNVLSNKTGIVNGTGIATGNIEFWPYNYSAPNGISIPGTTSTTVFDFGDTRGTSGNHGSMQIHNHGAQQTLFAISNWGSASLTNKFGLGIGNCPAPIDNGLDWTFAANSHTYDSRVLHVFVLPGDPDLVPPAVTVTTGATALNQVSISFNEPLAVSSIVPDNFSIAGLTVTGAKLLPGQRDVVLTTSPQTAGTAYAVAITGVRDLSPNANAVAAGTTANFTAPAAVPPLLAGIPEAAGYELLYRVAIPAARPQWNINPIPYSVDEAKFRNIPFDRVAYVLELDTNWVFTSFDRHTPTLTKLGIPTQSVTSTPFQMSVNNLTVASNVEGITTGTFATGGNIEFWGSNYNVANALNVQNASPTAYDWGDRMDSTGGYGSLQVHNYSQSQVLLAYNNWGSNSGSSSDIGIGNRSTADRDWTTSGSSTNHTIRNLYVLVRPVAPTSDGPVILVSPSSRTVARGGSTTFAVTVSNPTTGMTYQWRRNGQNLEGQTQPWLELSNVLASQTGGYEVVVTGENLASSTSTVAILTVPNSAPTFAGYQVSTPMNTTVVIPKTSLLAKASDADGDTLAVGGVMQGGVPGAVASVSGDNVTYAPPSGYVGAGTFAVGIHDGQGPGGLVYGTVHVTVLGNTALPTENAGAIGRREDGKIDLAFKGTVGTQYHIRRSVTLAEGSWETVATVTAGDDGVVPFMDPNPPEGKAFYRIELVAPPP